MNKLVIFDLDGVLYETRDMHFDTLNAALMYNGLPPISREMHDTKFNGLPTRSKLTMLGYDGAIIEAIVKGKQDRTETWIRKNVGRDLRLVSLFKSLHARGYKTAVASNAVRATVNLVLHNLWLDNLVDFTCAGNDGLPPKPDPAMFYRCMARAGSDPLHTIIIEDSPYGVTAAEATGARVVKVSGPHETTTAIMRAIGVEP